MAIPRQKLGQVRFCHANSRKAAPLAKMDVESDMIADGCVCS